MNPITKKENKELHIVLDRIFNNLIVCIGASIMEIDTSKIFTIVDIQITATKGKTGLKYSFIYSIKEDNTFNYRYIKPQVLLKKFK